MGRFIVIEGIDASGKTTVTQLLLQKLGKMGEKSLIVSKKTLNCPAQRVCNILINLKKLFGARTKVKFRGDF